MGYEVRMVKPGWEHPRDDSGKYIPLFKGEWYTSEINDFQNAIEEHGLEKALDEWDGLVPDKAEYMPIWEPGEATLYVMYEDVSEGTPLSPPFSTQEELADWLSKNCEWDKLSYDVWLGIIQKGYAVSAVFLFKDN